MIICYFISWFFRIFRFIWIIFVATFFEQFICRKIIIVEWDKPLFLLLFCCIIAILLKVNRLTRMLNFNYVSFRLRLGVAPKTCDNSTVYTRVTPRSILVDLIKLNRVNLRSAFQGCMISLICVYLIKIKCYPLNYITLIFFP